MQKEETGSPKIERNQLSLKKKKEIIEAYSKLPPSIPIGKAKIYNSEALEAIKNLKRFFLQKDQSEANLEALEKMKRDI